VTTSTTSNCTHRYAIEAIEGDGTVRNLWLKCEHCGDTLRKLTTRSDDEIAAELAGQ
jgi:hypothetical protein